VPRDPTLHNVIGVGDVTSDQQTAPAASTALESKTTAAYMWSAVRKLAEWPQGWRTARTWLTTASLGSSLLIGGLFAAVTAVSLVLSLATAWIVGLGVLVRAGALRLSARLAGLDRRRIGRLWGVQVDPLAVPETKAGTSFWSRQQTWVHATWLWRLPAYQLCRLLVAAALAFGAVAWWWTTVIFFVLAGQPGRPVLLLAWNVGPATLNPAEVTGLVIAGVVGVLAWPGVLQVVPAVDAALGQGLLGPSRTSQLSSEVVRLSKARSLAVESASAERRRIERDLHDGLQPELVNLALDLGLAKARSRTDPEGAWSLVERAHEDAKRAAEDLRNLVRGIHPSVLDERGLDAALSGLVASCTVPVSVSIDLPSRPSPSAVATAYFVVAEAVTNVTKHARARRAAVEVDFMEGALRVVVEDDGRGGARLEPAGGLVGLAARVASVDGTFKLNSPEGGPTRVEAVIPCAL
jgi:signal transduction histidine kinase